MATTSAAKKTAPAKAAAAAPKAERLTIGSIANASIIAGRDYEQTLADIKKKFPDANTTKNSYNWYRSNLQKNGVKVPELKAAKVAKPAAVAKTAPAKGKTAVPAKAAPKATTATKIPAKAAAKSTPKVVGGKAAAGAEGGF